MKIGDVVLVDYAPGKGEWPQAKDWEKNKLGTVVAMVSDDVVRVKFFSSLKEDDYAFKWVKVVPEELHGQSLESIIFYFNL